MATYKVTQGQNLFDIAIQLYGSIEGVYDLMISNASISMTSDLKAGQELEYHADFVINPSIVSYFKENKITPVNSERSVYYKETDKELRCVIDWLPSEHNAVLELSGDGDVIVDWGDSSALETISLTPTINKIVHYFNNVQNRRLVRLYGDFNIREFVGNSVLGNIIITKPLTVDEFKSNKNNLILTGLFLFNGTYLINLEGSSVDSLLPIGDMNLQELNINGCNISQSCIDKYLIYVATHYGNRRNCLVKMTSLPSGVYAEPLKDEYGNYIITSGMEAIWVITHEVSWNEAGDWVFNINTNIYRHES